MQVCINHNTSQYLLGLLHAFGQCASFFSGHCSCRWIFTYKSSSVGLLSV